MLEQTFFCIRPYIFEKRDIIKKIIQDNNLKIKKTKVTWLTEKDLRVMYGHEEPSMYFDASIEFMTKGFAEAGIVEGKDVISKLVQVASSSHIPSRSEISTVRRMFGKETPINFNSFDYYLNPLHRSRNIEEAEREVKLFADLDSRPNVETISNMIFKLHKDKNLLCVYYHHIEQVVRLGLELCREYGGNKDVVELSCWLHDIASLKSGKKYEHHIEGAKDGRKILELLGYKKEIIKGVQHCIQTHRGSFPLIQMTREAEIVCAADGIANLSNPSLLYFFAFKIKELDYDEGIKSIKTKVENSYDKIPQFAKIKADKYYALWQKI